MRKALVLIFAPVLFLVVNISNAFCQSSDVQTRERQFYDRARSAKQSIRNGFTPQQVVDILGQPDRRRFFSRGSNLIEAWGYNGFQIWIEFRDGVVLRRIFRFIP
jgi:hypothetical protein